MISYANTIPRCSCCHWNKARDPHQSKFVWPFETKRKAERGSEAVPFEECEGRIALEFAYVYPPGIPAAVPGERILAGTVEMLDRYRKAGLRIEGVKNEGKIEVLI